MFLELTAGMLFMWNTLYGDAPQMLADVGTDKEPRPVRQELANQPLTLEEYVREYYKYTPVLAEIAKCESHFRHLGRGGRVLRGELIPEDVGVMQINEFFHGDTAKVLGLNLHTLDGNLAYAKWLYGREGTKPWFSSSRCWDRSDTLARVDIRATRN